MKTLVGWSVVVSLAIGYFFGYKLIWGLFYNLSETIAKCLP
jgi:hypothetical protein